MKELKTKGGTVSVHFEPEERKLLEIASRATGHSCSTLLRNLFWEWLKKNEKVINEELEHRERIINILGE